MRRVLVPFVSCVLGVGACPCDVPPRPTPSSAVVGSDVVVASALDVLGKRLTPVRDYAVEGEVFDRTSKQRLRFRYAMKQPGSSAGELIDPATGTRQRAFVFDGATLAIVDDATKTVTRRDLSSQPEQMLVSLHQIFSQFVCEGWRPPLVKAEGALGVADRGTWTLTIPIVDEVLNSQRLILRTDGSFVKKELVDDRGVVVASTTVIEDWKDPGTGVVFPKSWTHTERGSTQQVTLTAMAVNAGVDLARFSTAVPAGYADRGP
jgi:hypothetical protein